MEGKSLDIKLANGCTITIFNRDGGVFVSLTNERGFIVSDCQLTKEEEIRLLSIL